MLINCRSCGHQVSREATDCPNCDASYPASETRRWVWAIMNSCVTGFLIFVVVIVIIAIVFLILG